METTMTVTRVTVVLIAVLVCVLVFSWILLPISRENRYDFYVTDGCDCRHQCEWQLTKMNETFNTLIAVCEEKLQKLHGSDMNMAIIREQLHKEILELFWYEFQTFQRLHNSKTENVPQICSEYCSTVDLAKYKDECKQNTTKLFKVNQQLLQRQRWLRFQLKLRLRPPKTQIEPAKTFSSTDLWAITVPITFIITVIVLVRMNKDRFATLEVEKARIETEAHTLQERNTTLTNEVQTLTANLEAQQQHTEEVVLDRERLCEELEARHTILTEQQGALLEQNGMLEYWNDALYTDIAERQFEIDNLTEKFNRIVQNTHKFWDRNQLKERKARQEYQEKLESTINSLKQNGLKRESKITNRYQERVNELKTMVTHMQENHSKQMHRQEKKQRDLETLVRELERERTVLIKDLEKLRMRCDVEIEGKRSAQDQVFNLEREVTALKAQTARLEEGIQTKSYKSSRPLTRFLRPPQTSNSIDSRLDDMRREFETRLVDLQSKFESQHAKDSEELRSVREEREELRKELESAKLQGHLAHQELVQPLLLKKQKNRKSSHTKVGVHQTKERLQKQTTFSRDVDFRTQPEPTYTYVSVGRYGNTEYRLSDSGILCQ